MENQNFYLKIENGKSVNHPIAEENLKQFFPDINPTNPPNGYVRFVRLPQPEIDEKHILDHISYELNDEYTRLNGTPTYTDVYHVVEISDEQKQKMIEEYKKMNPQQADWIFDEATQTLIPPIPKPTDGKEYLWMYPNETIGETQGRWVEKQEVVDANAQEFEALFQAMKELGVEINSNMTQEEVQELIEMIKNTVLQPPETPQGN